MIASELAVLIALAARGNRTFPPPSASLSRREEKAERELREGIRAILTYGGDAP